MSMHIFSGKIVTSKTKIVFGAATIVAMAGLCFIGVRTTSRAEASKTVPSSGPVRVLVTPNPNLSAESAMSVWVSADGSRQQVLFDKNPDKPLLIASLTKLMTADIVLEKYDLSDTVTLSQAAIAQNQDGRLKVGQSFSVKTLLSAMMIDSDNAAAYALSEKMGSEAFVSLMNEKAQTLGLSETHYTNSVGFGLENHSSANDIVRLVEWLLINQPSIFPVSITPKFDIYDSTSTFQYEIRNSDPLIANPSVSWSDAIVGNKTGNNKDAGQCLMLVVKAPSGDGYIVTVLLNSKDRFAEMRDIVDWDLSSYSWNS